MTRVVRRALSLGLVLLLVFGSLSILGPAPTARAVGQVSVYMSGLNWPIALAFSSDGRIFFAERLTGSIRIIQGGILLVTPFYTLPNTATAGERGLLGLALDPAFPAIPWVYAYQTYNDILNGTVYNRIVRILASGNTGTSLQVILAMPPLSLATNHNGGVIAFGPDGKLYAVVGENANPSLAQDPASPMGKVLRMNSDGSAPTDNPFYGNPIWNRLVYTYGHRNMFGLAFHPLTNRIYVTENGPTCNDEINLLSNLTATNRNFGWGPSATCATPPPAPMNTNRDGPNPIFPIWWWGMPTICPTNAAIYGGSNFPAWRGDMFMGDCNTGRFHRLHLVPPNYDTITSDSILWTAPTALIEVEQGPDGAIWLTTPSTIYRYWDSAQAPVASFTAAPNPVTVGTPVSFDASASSDPDGVIVSYAWEFGDATTGTGVTTSHTYTAIGRYHANLTVTDNESYTATASLDVVVRAPPSPPVASFTANPNPTNPGVTVSFDASASSDPDGTIVSYSWEFGDTSTGSGVTAGHAYATVGTYHVNLTVTDDQSLTANASQDIVVQPAPQPPIASFTANPNPTNPGVLVSFDASASSDPDGTIVSYSWEFGDAASGSGVTATHAYATAGTYRVNLTVVDNDAYAANASVDVVVQPVSGPLPPVALFSRNPSPVNPGGVVTFDASASYDPDGTIVSYAWEFGDSTTGTGQTATHPYAVPGVYTANLTVVDNQTLSSTASHTVNVNAPPRAAFTSSPAAVYIGVVVTFDATTSSDPDGTIVSYAWDFGDATTGAGQTATHTYASKGSFTVALVVTDNLGLTDQTTSVLIVGNRRPRIDASVPGLGPVAVVAGHVQTFTVTATDPDGDVLTYTWRVNGTAAGGNASGFDFSRATLGVYIVNVTVSDGSLATWREWTVTVTLLIIDNVVPVPWVWIVTVIAVAVLASVVFFLWWRRRRKEEPDVMPPPPPPPPP